jgi:hypothetical protein
MRRSSSVVAALVHLVADMSESRTGLRRTTVSDSCQINRPSFAPTPCHTRRDPC